MSELQQLVQSWLVALVEWLPIGYSFGAGMISTVNPCGFVMLPAYLSLYVGLQGSGSSHPSVSRRVGRALLVGLTASAGFVLLFAVIGTAVSAGGSFLIPAMPWMAVVIGLGLAGFGLAMLAGRGISVGFVGRVTSKIRAPSSASIVGFFLFGLAFGAASLSCTLPIFLMVVGSAVASGGFLSGLVQFVSYGSGMGLVLIALTLGIALFREGIIVGGLQRALPYVERAAAVLLVVAGSYIVYYWLVKGQLIKVFALAGVAV
jgi:cytochrome c biogenesis protein CcdA